MLRKGGVEIGTDMAAAQATMLARGERYFILGLGLEGSGCWAKGLRVAWLD